MRTIQSLFLKATCVAGIICYMLSAGLARGEEYVVVKGDSVVSICQKFQLSTEQLLTANPGLNPRRLAVGQQINIPSKSKNAAVANNAGLSWPGANSSVFKAALNYGVAQTLYSTFEFNNWCSPSDSKISQNTQQKLGKSVKVDIFANRDSDDNSLRVSVVFPDFSIENRKLVLLFVYDGTNYFFVENKFGEDLSKSDVSETNVNLILPQNYRTIVEMGFQPKADEVARIQRWCQETLKSNYPAKANGTNHFFVAPHNEKYDRRPVSLYWVEGKRVIEIDHLVYPDGKNGFLPKEMSDFSEPIQIENANDYASSCEWRDFTVSRHVIDGLLLTVDPAE